MVETGDVLGAQKMIMQEVESQVGGVAAANATASEKMQVAWGNFKEYIGAALLPVLDSVQNFITEKVLPGATMVFDAITGIGDLLKSSSTFAYLGTMGTVSLPLTAAIAEDRQVLRPGDRTAFLGIGSGLNCLMLGLEW